MSVPSTIKVAAKSKRLKLPFFIITFAALGSLTLFLAKAATPFGSLEPELGAITSSAILVADGTASGGQAVQFDGGSAAGRTYPIAGEVGFLGNENSLRIVNDDTSANREVPGSSWDETYHYWEINTANVTLSGIKVLGGIYFYGSGTFVLSQSVVEFDAAGNYSATKVNGRTGGATLDIRDSTLRHKAGSVIEGNEGHGAIQIGASVRVLAYRNDISGSADGIQTGASDTIIERNYIHDLSRAGVFPNNTHNDGIQVYNGAGLVIRNNNFNIEGPPGKASDGTHQNAAIFFQPGGSSHIDGPLIEGNRLYGGIFYLRLEGTADISSGKTSNVVVRNNVWGPFQVPPDEPTYSGYKNAPVTIAEWTNNKDSSGNLIGQFQ